MADWDAERYHRVSNPQLEWGRRVLRRLAPQPGERVLDLGCGTGRLTAELVAAHIREKFPDLGKRYAIEVTIIETENNVFAVSRDVVI